jgi:hypothetical protein
LVGRKKVAAVAMAMVISMGITSAMGYPYTPMHAALPFLALGKLNIA